MSEPGRGSSHGHYRLAARIDPQSGLLAAQVELQLPDPPPAAELEFLLHQRLQVEAVAGSRVSGYTRLPVAHTFAPEAVTWSVQLEGRPTPCPLTISVSYEGILERPVPQGWDVNRISPDWVELGLYGPWFPWIPTAGPFTYTARIGLPDGYLGWGLGEVSRQRGDWVISCGRPVEDLVVLASRYHGQLDLPAGDGAITIHYTAAADQELAARVAADCAGLLAFYSEWLGPASHRAGLAVTIAPRERGGGYARPGLVVLAGRSPAAGTLHGFRATLAHELAHGWWFEAETTTWEDWLNEAFAEYCALRALSRDDDDQLEQLLARRRERAAELPPICGIARSDPRAHDVLYAKGALILYQLEQLVGPGAFTQFLRARHQRGLHTTSQVLALAAEVLGPAPAAWLQEALER